MDKKELFTVRVKLMGLTEQLGKHSFADDNELLAEAVSKLMKCKSFAEVRYAKRDEGNHTPRLFTSSCTQGRNTCTTYGITTSHHTQDILLVFSVRNVTYL